MKKLFILVTALAVAATAGHAQNLLSNADFEMDGVTGVAPADWDTALSGASGQISSDYAQSGSYSLAIDSTGAGAWAAPNVLQTLPASPGMEYTLSGYMLHPDSDPITDASFGLLKLEFRDASDNLIDVAGLVSKGTAAGGGFPGAESTPVLDNASGTDSWIFSETVVTAPANAVTANFILLNVNQGPGAGSPSPMYFDNISATAVPEPTAFALFFGAAALGLVMYRRRGKA
jgi:hypothetical protein